MLSAEVCYIHYITSMNHTAATYTLFLCHHSAPQRVRTMGSPIISELKRILFFVFVKGTLFKILQYRDYTLTVSSGRVIDE
jgi:hypothetical protein